MRPRLLLVVLLASFAPASQAQQHQAGEWHCVRQVFIETTEGNVVVLQCLAALPKDEKLDAEDDDIIKTLDVARLNAKTFRQLEKEDPKHWPTNDPKGGVGMTNGLGWVSVRK